MGLSDVIYPDGFFDRYLFGMLLKTVGNLTKYLRPCVLGHGEVSADQIQSVTLVCTDKPHSPTKVSFPYQRP